MRKFTVAHVQRDPMLRVLAVKYLNEYFGNFEFLTSARHVLEHGKELHDGVIKGVLNCMQNDPHVENLPEPECLTFDAGPGEGEHLTRGITLDREAGKVVYEEKVRRENVGYHGEVYLKTRWPRPFMVSTRPNACLVHEINPHASKLVLYKNHNNEGDWYRWKIEWYCNPYLYMQDNGFKFTSRYAFLTGDQMHGLVTGMRWDRLGLPAQVPEKLADREWKVCVNCQQKRRAR